MSIKLTRLAATSFAAVALAVSGSALATPANAEATGLGASSALASTWIKYGDYSSAAKCKAKGEELRNRGTYLSYYCEYTGFFTLMVLTR
ncbi:hypothetical protein FHR32_007863 [Streptosporangium album]|uniref:Uncharacterized protein n=1 Tax=Streptosporangium album TaxID=47479 RepID=A0A7W7S562_9ACTN|nr:hypothetical protein [Streptosporangium album]MBB4943463.1 hypothetical protein [Streptosporangium album]